MKELHKEVQTLPTFTRPQTWPNPCIMFFGQQILFYTAFDSTIGMGLQMLLINLKNTLFEA